MKTLYILGLIRFTFVKLLQTKVFFIESFRIFIFFRFKEYVEPIKPYQFSRQYFFVLAVRFGFVILFQYFVFFTVQLLDWLIPDVPHKLEVRIKRENYIARERLSRSEAEASRDLNARVSYSVGSTNSVYLSCENIHRNHHSSLAGSRI